MLCPTPAIDLDPRDLLPEVVNTATLPTVPTLTSTTDWTFSTDLPTIPDLTLPSNLPAIPTGEQRRKRQADAADDKEVKPGLEVNSYSVEFYLGL